MDLVGLKPILRNTTSLQCFDTVGWVIWPAKTVPEMTYNVFSGTLNPTHFTSLRYHNSVNFLLQSWLYQNCWTYCQIVLQCLGVVTFKIFTANITVKFHWWLSGVVVRVLDLWLDGHKFDSQPPWLVLWWVTIFGWPNYLSISPSHPDQLNVLPQQDRKWVPTKVWWRCAAG